MLAVTPFDLEKRADHWFAHHLTWLHAPEALYYDLAHINVTMVALLGCWWWRSAVYRRARNALVLINVIGLVVFYLYPVAPPRLLPGEGFIDIVAESGTWGASPDSPTHANAFGSMPSLHTAWAVWVAVTVMACSTSVRLRALGWAHVVLTVVITVITGNHYVIDLVAGAVTAGLAWRVTRPREGSQDSPRQSAGSVRV
jgi:membrane-associated phospholipid phosphatase